jgi:hypothetical protein
MKTMRKASSLLRMQIISLTLQYSSRENSPHKKVLSEEQFTTNTVENLRKLRPAISLPFLTQGTFSKLIVICT